MGSLRKFLPIPRGSDFAAAGSCKQRPSIRLHERCVRGQRQVAAEPLSAPVGLRSRHR